MGEALEIVGVVLLVYAITFWRMARRRRRAELARATVTLTGASAINYRPGQIVDLATATSAAGRWRVLEIRHTFNRMRGASVDLELEEFRPSTWWRVRHLIARALARLRRRA